MCQNKTDYDNAIEYLQASPMFNLSLSSNELFHSNFLYWIWQVNKECFKKIINSLIGEENYWQKNWCGKGLEVRREYKNFDLSIVKVLNTATTEGEIDNTVNSVDNTTSESDNGDYTTDGLILFVLENKVKSIPYAQQLLKYNKKIDEHNEVLLKKKILEKHEKKQWLKKWHKEEGNKCVEELNNSKKECKKVLLSLTDAYPDIKLDEKGEFEGWKRRSYDEYLSYLQPINDQLRCTANKNALSEYKNIFDDYCKYIDCLSICIEKWNKFSDTNLKTEFGDYPYMETAENLRLHALYSQYNYAKLCCILMQELKKEGLDNVQYIRMQDDIILLTGQDNKKRGKFENYDDYFKDNEKEYKMLIGVGYAYTNKTPLLEVKVVKKDDNNQDKLIYIIQVQGNSYEHGIIRKGSKSDVENYIENNSIEWCSTIENNNIFAGKEVCKNYNGFNGTYSMVYKYRKIKPESETEEVVNYIVTDVEQLLEQLNK